MNVTCTPSREPIVNRVKPGALVVALGADAPGKRELAREVLTGGIRTGEGGSSSSSIAMRRPLLIADSIVQCTAIGEAAQLANQSDDNGGSSFFVLGENLVELGEYLGVNAHEVSVSQWLKASSYPCAYEY